MCVCVCVCVCVKMVCFGLLFGTSTIVGYLLSSPVYIYIYIYIYIYLSCKHIL